MSSHQFDHGSEVARLREEVRRLKTEIQELKETPAFYTDEINAALALWLKDPDNLASLVAAVRSQTGLQ